MKRPDKLAMIAIVFLILIFSYAYVRVWDILFGPPPASWQSSQPTTQERAYIKARHSYHGITSSVYDGATGERYFYRNGQRCKL